MPDAADMSVEIEAEHLAAGLRRISADIPAGSPGECEKCGEDMPRLVNGRCGFCRDGRPRPANSIGRRSVPAPIATDPRHRRTD